MDLRACLHGVGNPGLVGLVSFVFTLCGTQNKRNLPTRLGSPTPCKQGLRVCLHGGGGPQVGEVTRLGRVTRLSIQSLISMWSRLHVRWGNPPRVTSPTWGTPPSCKQALKCIFFTPTILYNHCYQFLLGITAVPREIEDDGYAKFWGTNKVHYGVWENSELYHLCLLLNNAS